MMTISLKLVICKKGFTFNRVTQKSDVRLNICIICCLYQNEPSDKIQLYFFQEFSNISKINHLKRLIEDLNVFRKYFRIRQEVNDEIQKSIYFIKYELQTCVENIISTKNINEKLFWLNGDGLKKFLTMNPMEKESQK